MRNYKYADVFLKKARDSAEDAPMELVMTNSGGGDMDFVTNGCWNTVGYG